MLFIKAIKIVYTTLALVELTTAATAQQTTIYGKGGAITKGNTTKLCPEPGDRICATIHSFFDGPTEVRALVEVRVFPSEYELGGTELLEIKSIEGNIPVNGKVQGRNLIFQEVNH